MAYIGNQPASAFASTEKQTITGNGTTGPYALTHEVAAATDIACFVNNVRQEPGVAYTVSGNQMTMTGNVASTDDFYVVYLGRVVGTVAHPANSGLAATSGTFSGDLTVDTSTLHVDAANNRVGVGLTTPERVLHVNAGTNNNCALFESTDANADIYLQDSGATGNTSVGLRGQSNDLVFITNGSETARLLSSGGLTFNGDTATTNALDDYEEGTWTPSVDVGTVAGTGARYVKVGQMVTIMAYVHSVSNRTAGNHFRVGGIPFDVHASAYGGGAVMGRYVNNGGDGIVLYAGANSNGLSLYTTLKGSDYTGIGHNDLNSASFNLYINFTYITDA